MDWTNIILGFFTLLSTCAWFVDGRKHRHEVEGLKADNRLKEMDLARQYVKGFEEAVCNPLRQQVAELKLEVQKLHHALQKIEDCPARDNCPVLDCLRHKETD
jgi:hypothetical protein